MYYSREEYNNEYLKIVKPASDKFIFIKVDDKKIEKIKNLTEEVTGVKKNELHHKNDNAREFKRIYIGFLGEAALEAYFNVDIIDWTKGKSEKYNHPDLTSLGIDVGIKTSEYLNFPIIFKKNTYSQIICIRYKLNGVYICGLATKDILNTYQNDNLILSPGLRQKGTKTAFTGYANLISLKNIKKIEEIKKLI
ncbi:hypothetical protein [Clostridium sp.]|uniref:hypothetical protein n=1 Tax=Clostridium sp. TaxID=1506 RepID=UPI003F7FE502